MPVGFGFSDACQSAGGARSDYQDQVAWLSQLAKTLEKLRQQGGNDVPQLAESLKTRLVDFKDVIEKKYEKRLGKTSSAITPAVVLRGLQWKFAKSASRYVIELRDAIQPQLAAIELELGAENKNALALIHSDVLIATQTIDLVERNTARGFANTDTAVQLNAERIIDNISQTGSNLKNDVTALSANIASQSVQGGRTFAKIEQLHLDQSISFGALEGSGAARHDLVMRELGQLRPSIQVNSLMQSDCIIFSNRTLRPVKQFVPRQALTAQLETLLAKDGVAAHPEGRIVVLQGLGGAGKSQLVLDYVRSHQSDYRVCFWLSANDRASLEREFTQIYRKVFNRWEAKVDELPNIQDIILAVRTWVREHEGPSLLVFDSADDITGDLDDETLNLAEFFPDGPLLDIIITTRSESALELSTNGGIRVGRMQPVEAVDLFCNNVKFQSRPDEQEVLAIVEELDYLALAITLAGHYVSRNSRLKSNISQYLPEYRQERKKHLDQTPSKLVHQYGASLITTWETSLKSVALRSKSAAILLNFLAFFHSNDVYPGLFCPPRREVVEKEFSKDSSENANDKIVEHTYDKSVAGPSQGTNDTVYEDGWETVSESGGESANEETNEHTYADVEDWRESLLMEKTDFQLRDIEDLFRYLEEYSLIQPYNSAPDARHSTTSTSVGIDGFQMHKLVHAWSYERLSSAEKTFYGVRASHSLGDYARQKLSLAVRLRLSPHVTNLVDLLPGLDLGRKMKSPAMAKSLGSFPFFFWSVGRYDYEEVTARLHLQCFQPGSVKYFDALSRISIELWEARKHEEALKAAEDAAMGLERLVGDSHIYTLRAMKRLAGLCRLEMRHSRAQQIVERTLEKSLTLYGRSNSLTMKLLQASAELEMSRGNSRKAEPILREVLDYGLAKYGPDSAWTTSTMVNLTNCLRYARAFDESILVSKKVVASRTKNYGASHPATFEALWEQGRVLEDAGYETEAAALFQDLIDRETRFSGGVGKNTMILIEQLAFFSIRLGNLLAGSKLLSDLQDFYAVFSDLDHRRHLRVQELLGRLYTRQGRLKDAADILRNTLSKQYLVNREGIQWTTLSLAEALMELGKFSEALCLVGQSRSRWWQHSILEARCLLALGRIEGVQETCHKVELWMQESPFGENHPSTLCVNMHLADAFSKMGQVEEALTLNQSLVNHFTAVLGEDYPYVMSTTSNLADNLKTVGRIDEAATLQRKVLETATKKYSMVIPDTLLFTHRLAEVLALQGNLMEAIQYQREAWQGRLDLLGETHPDTARSAVQLARLLVQDGQQDEALALVERTLVAIDGVPEVGPDILRDLRKALHHMPRDLKIWEHIARVEDAWESDSECGSDDEDRRRTETETRATKRKTMVFLVPRTRHRMKMRKWKRQEKSEDKTGYQVTTFGDDSSSASFASSSFSSEDHTSRDSTSGDPPSRDPTSEGVCFSG